MRFFSSALFLGQVPLPYIVADLTPDLDIFPFVVFFTIFLHNIAGKKLYS